MFGSFYSTADNVVLLMGDDKGRTGSEVERHTATTAFLVPAVVFPHDERVKVVLQLTVLVKLPSFGTHNCINCMRTTDCR